MISYIRLKFVNIELFLKEDFNQEDCLGWITIMEKAGKDLRTVLKEEKIQIEALGLLITK